MTELISGFHSHPLGRSGFGQMPEGSDHPWKDQYFPQMTTMLGAQWPHTQAPGISGIQELDVRMWPHSAEHSYAHSFGGQQPMSSPHLSYNHQDAWSEMNVDTPSTTGFPSEAGDSYPAPSLGHLHPPDKHRRSDSAQSPRSSHSGISPRVAPLQSPRLGIHATERPPFPRSITAPEQRRSTGSIMNKRGGSDEDDDDDYVPSEDPKAVRGRKRQRIPHTAVERRYRENLNAHLDKLRQTVPSLASRKGPGKEGGEGVKPSKCEVLNGAIEHIGALDRDNAALKNEVSRLRAKIGEMETWYRSNSR